MGGICGTSFRSVTIKSGLDNKICSPGLFNSSSVHECIGWTDFYFAWCLHLCKMKLEMANMIKLLCCVCLCLRTEKGHEFFLKIGSTLHKFSPPTSDIQAANAFSVQRSVTGMNGMSCQQVSPPFIPSVHAMMACYTTPQQTCSLGVYRTLYTTAKFISLNGYFIKVNIRIRET